VQVLRICNENELLASLKQGSETAFTKIYNHYWDKLFSLAANKLDKDLSLAEELVQDIFLDLWDRRDTLEIKGELTAYLATAMKYKIIDARRKRVITNQYNANVASRLIIADHTTEKQLQFDELQSRLSELVNALPEKCQLVYKLSKETGLSQKNIAVRLNISEKTVESHLSRALKQVRIGMAQILSFVF
jgi:RNA polymerase sigma-70 factor (family 1)